MNQRGRRDREGPGIKVNIKKKKNYMKTFQAISSVNVSFIFSMRFIFKAFFEIKTHFFVFFSFQAQI